MIFDGQRVNDLAPSQRGIAMVFQSYALYPHMKVYDNMAFGMKLQKAGADEIKARVEKAAKMLQIDHLLDRLPKQLSGGQRQRVAIGRAIVRDPQGLPVRRAALQPRRGAARGDPARDRQAAPRDEQRHDDLRDPRPGRGDDAGRPHLRAARRPRHAGRHADRALREAELDLRRRLHRLAEDELPQRRDRQGLRLPTPSASAPSTSSSTTTTRPGRARWCTPRTSARTTTSSSTSAPRSRCWSARRARPRSPGAPHIGIRPIEENLHRFDDKGEPMR